MIVKTLSVKDALRELKYEQKFNADDKDTKLAMLPCGHFVVSKYGHNIVFMQGCVAAIEASPDVKSKKDESAR